MLRPLLVAFVALVAGAWDVASVHAQSPAGGEKIRVACVGDSNTFGHGVEDREKNSYPAQMQRRLGDGHVVRNFGVSGATMLKRGDMPYVDQNAYRQALDFAPHVVVLALGANDSKPQNWRFKDEFAADAKSIVESFRALPTKPRVIVAAPMPAFETMWGINDAVIRDELIPQLRRVAFEADVELVDLHTALAGHGDWFPDHIHPDKTGCAELAKVVGRVVAFEADPAFDLEAKLAAENLKVEVSSFHGYRQLKFTPADGRERIVVRPRRAAAHKKIVWRGEFFGHEPQFDLALLQLGYHVVYASARDMYGSPEAMAIWDATHDLLKKLGLTGKITLVGMSRGGLYAYAWAARRPETVDALYGDAPVCDFRIWPGANRAAKTKTAWSQLLKTYGFQDDAEALAYAKNPVDDLAPLAKAGIPIVHVVGQADDVVPVETNTDVVERRYKELGGEIVVIRKPGVGHHPHSLANPEPIVEFVLEHAK